MEKKEIGLIPYRIGDKWGYSTKDYQIIIPCIYDWACPFSEDRAIVKRNNLWGVINLAGELICKCKYEDIGPFHNGRSAVKNKDKWGFINQDGVEVISFIYDQVLEFCEERAAVKIDGKIGFINTEGERITELKYDDADSFKNGFAPVKQEGKHGCINYKGDEVVLCISDIPVEFSEGLAAISFINNDEQLNETAKKYADYKPGVLSLDYKGGQEVLVDSNGNVFDSESIKLVSQNHRCGYVNSNKQIIIPFMFDLAFPFKEGLACVCSDAKFGFIKQDGKWLAPNVYEDAGDFNEGLAKVRLNGKWGYIDTAGEVVIDFKFEQACNFKDGLAKVTLTNGMQVFINSQGLQHQLQDIEFKEGAEKITYFEEENFSEDLITASFSWSDICYIGKSGRIVTDLKFVEAEPFKNGIAFVKYREADHILAGYIDTNGNEYWEKEMSIIVKQDSVVIGDQEWTLFNFDGIKFRNGDPIVHAQSDEEWEACNEKMLPAWCFNPEKSLGTGAFGKLYNWYAVSDPRGIAPDGWHVPDFNEWLSLLKYLGPGPRQGVKLKSARLWDGNNESGFDALPAGIRSGPPDVESWEYCGSSIEEFAAWWLIDESQDENKSTALFLTDQEPEPLFFLEFKNQGFSLRLIKNSSVF